MRLSTAIRSLRRTPALSTASVLTLTLAIGVNTAMFSIVYGVLLRPLPFADPSALIQLNAIGQDDRRPADFSIPEFADWQQRTRAFGTLALFGIGPFTITGAGEAEAVRGAFVSDQWFATLGTTAAIGRALAAADDRLPVVAISHRMWRRLFNARPDIAGAAVTLNDQRYTIVGVMPASFRFPAKAAATAAQRAAAIERILQTVSQVGGVRSAAVTSSLPPDVSQMHTSVTTAARQASGQQDVSVDIVAASSDLFATLGIPLLRGRSVAPSDTADSQRVIVLSETAALRLFPDRDPLSYAAAAAITAAIAILASLAPAMRATQIDLVRISTI